MSKTPKEQLQKRELLWNRLWNPLLSQSSKLLVSSKRLTTHTCSEHIASSIPFRACFFYSFLFHNILFSRSFLAFQHLHATRITRRNSLKTRNFRVIPPKHPMNRELLKILRRSKHFFYTRHLFAAFSKKENLQSFALEKADK